MRTNIDFHGLDVCMDLDTNEVFGVRITDAAAVADWLETHHTEALFETADEAAQAAYERNWRVG